MSRTRHWKGSFPDEELSRFLESNCSGAETMGFLDTTSCVLRTDERRTQVDYKITLTVLRADDLAASCLQGALPEDAHDDEHQVGQTAKTMLTTGGLACCLLGTWHLSVCKCKVREK